MADAAVTLSVLTPHQVLAVGLAMIPLCGVLSWIWMRRPL